MGQNLSLPPFDLYLHLSINLLLISSPRSTHAPLFSGPQKRLSGGATLAVGVGAAFRVKAEPTGGIFEQARAPARGAGGRRWPDGGREFCDRANLPAGCRRGEGGKDENLTHPMDQRARARGGTDTGAGARTNGGGEEGRGRGNLKHQSFLPRRGRRRRKRRAPARRSRVWLSSRPEER